MILDLRKGFGTFDDYSLTKFPDGSVKFIYLCTENIWDAVQEVKITLRTNDDVMALCMVSDVLSRLQSMRKPTLFITYMMYQQDDRLFDEKESFGLRVVANILNTLWFSRIVIFHPHSDKVELINNCEIISNENFVTTALKNLNLDDAVWVIPDAGAFKTQYKLLEKGRTKQPFITALKSRDHHTGAVSTIINTDIDLTGTECVIVDDICLGGRTFINIANILKAKGVAGISLIVSHGIFNYGLEPLRPYLEHIYTTDSICTLPEDDFLKVYKL